MYRMPEIQLDLSRDTFLISDRLFFELLRRLVANEANNYVDNLTFNTPGSDAMLCKIGHGDDEITITRMGENDARIKIQGEKILVKKFLRQMAVEAAAIVTKELFIDSVCSKEHDKTALLYNVYKAIEELFEQHFDSYKIKQES